MIFLGREIARTQDYSEETAVEIDGEVKRIVDGRLRAAPSRSSRTTATSSTRIADALLEREVLDGDEVYQIISDHTGVPVERLKGPGRPVPEVV